MSSRTECERRALVVIERHGVTAPPVPVERIAEAEGIQVVRGRPAEYELTTSSRDGTARVIDVSAHDSPARERFIVGHRMGHLLLHGGHCRRADQLVTVPGFYDRPVTDIDQEEFEANGFASALLIPEDMAITAMRDHLFGSMRTTRGKLIDALAAIFDVTVEAVEYRLIKLGLLSP